MDSSSVAGREEEMSVRRSELHFGLRRQMGLGFRGEGNKENKIRRTFVCLLKFRL